MYKVFRKDKHNYEYEIFDFKITAWLHVMLLKIFTNSKPYMEYLARYNVYLNLDIDYQDIPPWRSYYVEASGENFYEVIGSAVIVEIDQDGGELNHYDLKDAEKEVHNKAITVLNYMEY